MDSRSKTDVPAGAAHFFYMGTSCATSQGRFIAAWIDMDRYMDIRPLQQVDPKSIPKVEHEDVPFLFIWDDKVYCLLGVDVPKMMKESPEERRAMLETIETSLYEITLEAMCDALENLWCPEDETLQDCDPQEKIWKVEGEQRVIFPIETDNYTRDASEWYINTIESAKEIKLWQNTPVGKAVIELFTAEKKKKTATNV